MSANTRNVVRQLNEFAAEIAGYDRVIHGVQWYREREQGGTGYRSTPIVPLAIHDALCPNLAVRLEDPAKEIVVCDCCGLAVESGAS